MVEGASNDAARLFEEFYNAQSLSLLKHCQIRLGDRSRAEEIAQEAFLRTWNAYQKRRGQLENIRAYLYRVAHNLIVDHFRRASRRREVSLEQLLEEQGDKALPSEEPTPLKEDRTYLTRALKTLKPDLAHVLVLRYSNELSISEIATVIQKTENATSIILYRAREALKAALDATDNSNPSSPRNLL